MSYEPPPPPEATDAMPGTAEKQRVLCRRRAKGYGLWHPDDAGMDQFGVARLPIIENRGHHRVDWRVVNEVDYRRADQEQAWADRTTDDEWDDLDREAA